ncbi:MAG: CHAT domain-containing protein [Cyanobacteria bacterium J06643_5]
MQVLRFDLKPSQDNYVELRYFFKNSIQYEERYLNLAEITDLVQIAERDYYTALPEQHDVTGKRLFDWLDGDDRWLSRAIRECRGEELVVAIKAEQQLTHLPWEVLHDGDDFLINRVNPVVVPVRWIEGDCESKELEARPLRVLFMATSPLNVTPVLDFEQEEATILQETAATDSPLELRVEESGSTSGLQKVWSRYTDTFDVFHLSGHASINNENAVPYFITETETGERFDTTAEELAKVLQFRFPKLVFLSGCRTGESIKNGTLPSMAETLINQGATAVLGWGRPVTDTGATVAAAKLYGKLADGYSLPQALACTYKFLLKSNIRDWHLLRLYVQGECPGALVNPLGDEVWIPEEPVYEQFLDPVTQLVRVATPDQFVGRRRTLQRCLKQLGISKNLGVLIHGMGGVGKSTVTARLLERMTGYDRIFIYRGLDELKLLNRLSEQCTSENGHEILNGKLPLMQRLTKFFQAGLNRKEQRFTFVLDDFEANLELRNGNYVLKSEVVSVLTDLLKAIQKSRLPHRVIITSRYDFKLPQLDRNIYREPLAALRNADLIKKYNRLESFNGTVDIDPELQSRAKKAADGNPRLLEWLDKILGDGIADVDIILEKIETAEKEFRENILAEELLKQQDADLKKLLGKALVYELPVPKAAISPICQDISNLDSHIQRGASLGLLEVNLTSSREELYRVSRILEPLLEPENKESLSGEAAKILYQLWWENAETPTEEQKLEIHRLALLGKETEIAGNLASNLANTWKKQSRFREVVPLLETGFVFSRYLLN